MTTPKKKRRATSDDARRLKRFKAPPDQRLESLRGELKALLECPVKWEDFFGSHQLIDELYFLWLCMIQSYPWQVRSEGELVNDINEVCKAHELSFDIANLKSWIKHVEGAYLEWVSLFHRTHLLDQAARPKHWPLRSWTREEVNTRSGGKSGSIFYPEITAHELESTLQGIMGVRFEEFLDEEHTHYFVDLIEPIGAAHKRPTSHICFEIDYSTPACHAYPISIEEIPEDRGVLELVEDNRQPYGNPIKAGDIRIVD